VLPCCATRNAQEEAEVMAALFTATPFFSTIMKQGRPRVVMARTFWVVVRGEKSITAYSLAFCSFFLSHLSLTTCSSSFCCPCTFASNCTTGLLSKQVAAEKQLWTKRRWCMQQQQDRHQNILSQTKRLLSHHHHNHHLSNAQHLQILSNSMKTLWQSFFTYEIPYTRQEEQEKEEEAEEYDESRTSV
jgi:hypothetical protein